MVNSEYKTLISELTEEFKKAIPENEQKLIDEFEKYLYSTIETLEKSNSEFILKDRDSITAVLRRIAQDLIVIDLDSKKQKLLPDNSFWKISEISGQIYEDAQNILNNKGLIVEFDYTKEIDKMTKLLETVELHNKEQAKLLVSEAILDLEFIANPKTDILSLRLARLKKILQSENGREIKLDEVEGR